MMEPALEEIWEDIPNYEGLYQVSNLGRVRSLDREVSTGKGTRIHHGKVLKQSFDGKHNYLQVSLCKKGKIEYFNVHRLVAQAFIPKNNDKTDVNHKNRIKVDNRVENLEWCTKSENIQHRYANKNINDKSNGVKGAKNKKAKKVYQYDLDNNLVKIWGWAGEIQEELGIDRRKICDCCLHNKQSNGYIWKYAN